MSIKHCPDQCLSSTVFQEYVQSVPQDKLVSQNVISSRRKVACFVCYDKVIFANAYKKRGVSSTPFCDTHRGVLFPVLKKSNILQWLLSFKREKSTVSSLQTVEQRSILHCPLQLGHFPQVLLQKLRSILEKITIYRRKRTQLSILQISLAQ